MASHGRAGKLKESRRLLRSVNTAAPFICDAPAPEVARIDPAQAPHCPHCGGQRVIRIALPKEEVAAPTGGGDTS